MATGEKYDGNNKASAARRVATARRELPEVRRDFKLLNGALLLFPWVEVSG